MICVVVGEKLALALSAGVFAGEQVVVHHLRVVEMAPQDTAAFDGIGKKLFQFVSHIQMIQPERPQSQADF